MALLTQFMWATYALGVTLVLTALLVKHERVGKRTASVGLALLAASFLLRWWS